MQGVRRLLLAATISLCLGAGLLGAGHTAYAADNYVYPLDSWYVEVEQGTVLGSGAYHMGIDAGGELPAGAPVYAVADGVVKEVRTRTLFGLVILIEHTLSDGSKNVSLYGHLRPSDARVSVGQTVSAGDVIGVLGTPEENGGWPVHIHFGIHKTAYSSVWIYYGHVRDPATGEEWHLPEQFIEDRLTTDTWFPTINTSLEDGDIVTNTASFTVDARDIGSGVERVVYRVSDDDGVSWDTLAESDTNWGTRSVYLPLSQYDDGDLLIKAVVYDRFNNKTKHTVSVVKDPERYTTKAVVGIQTKPSAASLTQWSMGESLLGALYPFGEGWKHGGDVAVDLLNMDDIDEELSIITAKGSKRKGGRVLVYNPGGQLEQNFKAMRRSNIRVDTGDLDGDGQSEIVVGSGPGIAAKVKVFSQDGTLLWSESPFANNPKKGIDVATADVDGDGADEVIVGMSSGPTTKVAVLAGDGSGVITRFKPFGNRYRGGVNVAGGNVKGDERDEIIVATAGNRSGQLRVFSGTGKRKVKKYLPFGEEFNGEVDVSTMQWEYLNEESAGTYEEIVVSQASGGDNSALIISADDYTELFRAQLYSADSESGTRIDGWQ